MLARKNGEQCSTVDKVPNVEGPPVVRNLLTNQLLVDYSVG